MIFASAGDTRALAPLYAGGWDAPREVRKQGLAYAAGVLISLSYSLQPTMGDAFIIKAFVVCVLGGLGSVQGALVGGLLYGVLEAFGAQYIGTDLNDAVALVVLLVVLIVRPTGIMGKATA